MTLYFHRGLMALREITEADLPVITAMRNDWSTWSMLGDPRMLKPGLQRRWLDSLNQSSDRLYFMAIRFNDPQAPVGLVRMDEYDLVNRSIRVGADVMPDKRREGFGSRIYETIEAYAFDILGLHRIWLLVLEGNGPARELYKQRGFRVEGRMRQAIFRFGKWRDYIMMSLLEPEYRSRQPGNKSRQPGNKSRRKK